ncbi:cytochrome b/b6 domain-containing protein [Geoglobus sp.]
MLVRRFSRTQIAAHFVISLSIFMLIITGLPITFSKELGWVMGVLGGSQVTMLLHRLFAVILTFSMVYFGIYFLLERLTGAVRDSNLSLSPRFFARLAVDMVKDILWALGVSKERPKAGKYDWIMVADIFGVPLLALIEVVTGLIMWFPFSFIESNPALFFAVRLIHAAVAVFFVLFIFAHATVLHLTPGNYPVNMSIFTGKVSLRKAELEHPEWVGSAEMVEGRDEHSGFSYIALVGAAVVIVTTLMLGYVLYVTGMEGLAGLRIIESNPVTAAVLNVAMAITLIFAVANIAGIVRGIKG